MSAYLNGGGGVRIWSFEENWPVESKSRAIADGMLLPSRATDEEAQKNNQSNYHSHCISSIAFSDDGKVVASCAYSEKKGVFLGHGHRNCHTQTRVQLGRPD
jgi:hypothetical protein